MNWGWRHNSVHNAFHGKNVSWLHSFTSWLKHRVPSKSPSPGAAGQANPMRTGLGLGLISAHRWESQGRGRLWPTGEHPPLSESASFLLDTDSRTSAERPAVPCPLLGPVAHQQAAVKATLIFLCLNPPGQFGMQQTGQLDFWYEHTGNWTHAKCCPKSQPSPLSYL